MRKFILLSVMTLFPLISVSGQNTFALEPGERKDKIRFELINNLIIVPVELNGIKLSFLLDTGVNTTVLLGLDNVDSLDLRNSETVKLKGIGSDEHIEALKSEGNQMRVGKAVSDDLTIFLILDQNINFSPRLGFPVHGILGHDFFRNFIVEINYQRKFLRLYPLNEEPGKVRKYEAVPLVFYKNKPYVNTLLTIKDSTIRSTLLLDSGLADALWLFEDGQEILVPDPYYDDFLGLGLVGDIFGKRSRSSNMTIAEFELDNILTSFPDTTAFGGLKFFTERNGSIGGEILRRFHLIFNYSELKLYMKKNSHFDDEYFTNMSGITVEHDGFVVIRSSAKAPSFSTNGVNQNSTVLVSETTRVQQTFSLKPEFRIARLRKDSPAERAGLKVGDHIVSINSRSAYKMDIEEIARLFASKEGKRIKMKIKRNGSEQTFIFHLERAL